MQTLSRFLICAFATAAICACGKPTAPAPSAAPAVAVMPADAKLARLYEQTCKTCHGTGAGGAPISGDRAAWEPRAAQGMAALMEHTLSGYKGMPPLGSCGDCSPAEFDALIRFMAGM